MSNLSFGKNATTTVDIEPTLLNRHGLITGATGTGKTISLQVLAERMSSLGIPVFMADVKGDLSGLAANGKLSDKLSKHLKDHDIPAPTPTAFPTSFWDVLGEKGHPIRATISDLGPLLLSRLLNLNDIQEGVLHIVFRIADDEGLLLLDLKDLKAMVQAVGENAKAYTTDYGNISAASIGAIMRSILTLENEGAEQFFGEPMLNIDDLMQTVDGMGVINILSADRLINTPRTYSILLLWLLSELFERLPEVGDLPKPKLVFFFDEAHLLFSNAPPVLLEKVEQLVRLIRSKGVGVYFVSQNPLDIPDKVLGQLGNRIQHALRAFTPRDQKAVKVAAETLRPNPKINAEVVITELSVGEALVSMLNDKGTPNPVERVFILPPASRIGPLSADEQQAIIKSSLVYGQYEETIDRESAYERLKGKVVASSTRLSSDINRASTNPNPNNAPNEGGGLLKGLGGMMGDLLEGSTGAPTRSSRVSSRQGIGEALVKSVVRTVGSEVGRQLVRGLLGSLRR